MTISLTAQARNCTKARTHKILSWRVNVTINKDQQYGEAYVNLSEIQIPEIRSTTKNRIPHQIDNVETNAGQQFGGVRRNARMKSSKRSQRKETNRTWRGKQPFKLTTLRKCHLTTKTVQDFSNSWRFNLGCRKISAIWTPWYNHRPHRSLHCNRWCLEWPINSIQTIKIWPAP